MSIEVGWKPRKCGELKAKRKKEYQGGTNDQWSK